MIRRFMGAVYPRLPALRHVLWPALSDTGSRRLLQSALVSFTAAACAIPSDRVVEGMVVALPSETPIEGALVRGEAGAETHTDSRGKFRLRLPSGRETLLRAAHGRDRCPGEARVGAQDAADHVRIGLLPRLEVPEDRTNVGFDQTVELSVATPCDETPIVRWRQVMGPDQVEIHAEAGGRKMRIRTPPAPGDLPDGFVALTPETQGEYRFALSVELASNVVEHTVRVTAAPLSSGLPNVPLGIDQYVSAATVGEWSVSPNLRLDAGSGKLARFRAIKPGAFWIRRGEQTWRGLAERYEPSATCVVQGCHRSEGTAWQATPHHQTAEPGAQCAECHATGGFAETPVEHGVGCVACHGPGHPGELASKQLWEGRSCRSCHDAHEGPGVPHELAVVRDWDASAKSQATIPTGRACARCHSGNGFRAFVDATPFEGEESARIGCPTCHASHASTAPLGLPVYDRLVGELGEMPVAGLGTGAVCAQCHSTDVPDIEGRLWAPHAPQTNVLIGRAAMLRHRASEVGPHSRLEDSCVACHMATPDDDHSGRAGGHTFAVRDLEAESDLLVSSACESCHGTGVPASAIGGLQDRNGDGIADGVRREFDRELVTVRRALRERIERARIFDSCGDSHQAADVAISGLLVVLVDTEGRILGDCDRDGALDADETDVPADRLSRHVRRLAWDVLLLERDGSHGLHNPGFAFELLAAIREGI